MQKKEKRMAAGFLLLTAFLLGGCSVGRFRPLEEENSEVGKTPPPQQSDEPKDIDYKDKELIYEEELSLPSGGIAARYRAALPQFQEQEDKNLTLRKINEYYEIELIALKQDCESYFKQIEASYGPAWQTAVEPVAEYSVDFSYEVVQSNDRCISVVRSYHYVDTNVKNKVVYTAETFDCQTGWPKKIQELFIEDKSKVQKTIVEQIEKWCQGHKIDYKSLSPFSIEKQDSSFALSEETLYLCMDESSLSAGSQGGQLVEIPLENIREILLPEHRTEE